MHPFMIETHLPMLGALDVPSYFLMVMLAFLVGSSLVVRDARRNGYRVIDFLDLSLFVLLVGMAGARLAFVFLASPDIELPVPQQSNTGWTHYFCRMAGEDHLATREWNLARFYLLHPHMVFAVWTGGFVFYGGLLAVIPGGLWFCRRRGISFWQTADLAAPAGAAALALGRIGCLLASCCHGGPARGVFESWGVVFTRGVPGHLQHIALYPTQLLEAMIAVGICLALYRTRRLKRFDGQIFVTLLLAYGLWRPLVEILRDDPQRGIYGGASTSQWISIGIVLAGVALIPVLWRRRSRPTAGGATETPSSGLDQPAGANA